MIEELTSHSGRPRVFHDEQSLTVVDGEMVWSYHKACGGLLFVHPLVTLSVPNNFREYQMMARGLIRLCRCHHLPDEEYPARKLLTDINMALDQCRTVEDVKLMIMEMASSIEMREQAL